MFCDKNALKGKLLTLGLDIPFKIIQGEETDLMVEAEFSENDYKITFKGYLLLDEGSGCAYYKEDVFDKGQGINQYGDFFSNVSYSKNYEGKTIAFNGLEDGVLNFKTIREKLKKEIEEYGWKFELVLIKEKATYTRYELKESNIVDSESIIKLVPLLVAVAATIFGGYWALENNDGVQRFYGVLIFVFGLRLLYGWAKRDNL